MLSRAAIVCVLCAALAGLLGCTSTPPGPSDQVELGPMPSVLIEWDYPNMNIEHWTNASDLVVLGTVVQVDTPRWNSGDGRSWNPRRATQEAVVYQTFYVEPEETLRGAPQWGTPIAFRAVWWNSPTGGGRFTVGDRVMAFGYQSTELYGGGVYQPADAYWLISGGNSLWVEEDGRYFNQGVVGDQDEMVLELDELKARIREGGGPTTLGMWDPARVAVKAGWGETVTVEGALRLTATAPQIDPAGRPVEPAPDGIVVYCMVTIENVGNEPRSYDLSWLSLTSAREGWSGGGDGLQTSVSPALKPGTLDPGETVTGAVAFQFSPGEVSLIHTLRFDTWTTRRTETPVVLVEWGPGEGE